MIDIGPHIEKVFLNPGELLLTEKPVAVTTVLGSCVAVTCVARDREIGAICHAVLPSGPGNTPGKYIDQSFKRMIAFFRENQIKRRDITIKVFGGSDMFTAVNPAKNLQTIGAQNVRKIFACLKEAGLEAAATDVGGTLGRKLIFLSYTGEVFIKKIKREQFADLEESPAKPSRDYRSAPMDFCKPAEKVHYGKENQSDDS